MDRIIATPIFNQKKNKLTSDNFHIFISLKYLCLCGYNSQKINIEKNNCKIDFFSLGHQRFNEYLEKPSWLNNFQHVNDFEELKKKYEKGTFFVNSFFFRGYSHYKGNVGFDKQYFKNLDLTLTDITKKSLENEINLSDLKLKPFYEEYLKNLIRKKNELNRPIIVFFVRDKDPWRRNAFDNINKIKKLISEVKYLFPHHLIVLTGDVNEDFKSEDQILKINEILNQNKFGEKKIDPTLKFLLEIFFIKDAEIIFSNISGFSHSFSLLRDKKKLPIIPIHWNMNMFEKKLNLSIDKVYGFKNKDNFEYDNFHFVYHNNNINLREYCEDYPNTNQKILKLLDKLLKSNWLSLLDTKIIKKDLFKPENNFIYAQRYRLPKILFFLYRISFFQFIYFSLKERLKKK